MAIAYFIPDQAKLLAASTNNNSSQTNSNNISSGASNHTTSSAGSQTHTQSTNNSGGPHSHHNSGGSSTHNNNFRANITIPLSAYSGTAAHSDVGCWDLLTQIFCHALRFCHQTERHPTVIQISLEISSSGPNGDTTVQVGATAAPVQQQQQEQQQGQQENAHAVSPSLVVPPTTGPRNPTTPQTQNNLTAADRTVRPTTTAPLAYSTETPAAMVGSRDLEPGTHKPSVKRN